MFLFLLLIKKYSINTHKTINNKIIINYYSIIRIEVYQYNVLSYELIIIIRNNYF